MTKAHEKCLDSMDEIRMDLKEIHVKIFNILKEMIEAYKLTAREKNVTCSILNERLSWCFFNYNFCIIQILVLSVSIVIFCWNTLVKKNIARLLRVR